MEKDPEKIEKINKEELLNKLEKIENTKYKGNTI